MTERTRGILKLIPFAIITAFIVLLLTNELLFFFTIIALNWIASPIFILAAIFFCMSLRCRNKWQIATVVWGAVNVLLFAIYLLIPKEQYGQKCNPDIMAAHYEEHRVEMEALHKYLHDALKDSCVIHLVLDGNQVDWFYVGNYYGCENYHEGDVISRLDSMMAVAGLSQEEFDNIRQQLKTMGCIGVYYNQYTADLIQIRFCCDKWGCYMFNLREEPKSNQRKKYEMSDKLFVPYNEYCTFVYDGSMGAFDSGGFSERVKRSFLKKHKPW